MQNKISCKQSDGYESYLYQFLTSTSIPSGTFVIFHGMAEHHNRYQNFADFLNGYGYDVYLYDHRGHGTDKKLEELGFFTTKEGDKRVIEDAISITKYVKERSRSKKIILFGHSMGSLILRNVLHHYDEIDCAIVCGTTNPPKLATRFGILLSATQIKLKGPKHRSYFLNNLLFNSKHYKKICNRTAFDWLSRNNPSIGTYIDDPYCGFICTSSFYNDLFHLTLNATKIKLAKNMRRDLPILIISGDHDPVGNLGKQISNYFLLLQRLGFKSVDCTLYADCRHELLNELNREEIMQDIVDWVEKHA